MSFSSKLESSPRLQGSDCKLCFNPFNEEDNIPKVLSCGHTICLKCCRKLWIQDAQNTIYCPFDRIPTRVTGLGELPTNFSMIELINSFKTKTHAEDVVIPERMLVEIGKCEEDESHEALVYCEICEVDLCEECFNKIHLSKIFASHEKIPISQKPYQLPKCSIHPNKKVVDLCVQEDCDVIDKLCCENCRQKEHKGHATQNILPIIEQNREQLERTAKEMERYCNGFNFTMLEKITSSYENPTSYDYSAAEQNIRAHYECATKTALKDWNQFREKKLVDAKKQEAFARKEVETLENIQRDIRTRLRAKKNFHNIDKLMERSKANFKDARLFKNRERSEIVSKLCHMKFKLPKLDDMRFKIIDYDEECLSGLDKSEDWTPEPSTSGPSTSEPSTSGSSSTAQ